MHVQLTFDGAQFEKLESANVITLDPKEAKECCGIERDAAGRCQNRPHHPIYVRILRARIG